VSESQVQKPIWYLVKMLGFVLAIMAVSILALLPREIAVHLSSSDKIDHFAAFAVLMILGQLASPARFHVALGLGLIGFGALIEVLQAVPKLNRSPDLLDWLVEVAAVLVVGVVYAPVAAVILQLRNHMAGR
jgi:hypothetical protein